MWEGRADGRVKSTEGKPYHPYLLCLFSRASSEACPAMMLPASAISLHVTSTPKLLHSLLKGRLPTVARGGEHGLVAKIEWLALKRDERTCEKREEREREYCEHAMHGVMSINAKWQQCLPAKIRKPS